MAQVHENDYYYKIIRKNLRKYRLLKGYTQEKLAEKCLMSYDYYVEIENVKKNKSFSIAVLGEIADTLEVDIRDFFNED